METIIGKGISKNNNLKMKNTLNMAGMRKRYTSLDEAELLMVQVIEQKINSQKRSNLLCASFFVTLISVEGRGSFGLQSTGMEDE